MTYLVLKYNLVVPEVFFYALLHQVEEIVPGNDPGGEIQLGNALRTDLLGPANRRPEASGRKMHGPHGGERDAAASLRRGPTRVSEALFTSLTPNQRSVAIPSLFGCMATVLFSFQFSTLWRTEMPVIKLTQESISKLRCPEDKRSVQILRRPATVVCCLRLRSIDQDQSTW